MRRLHVTRAAIAAILATLCLAGPLPTLHAAIVFYGDVVPDNPGDWNSATNGCVGIASYGTVTVNDLDDLNSRTGSIGCYLGSTGVVTVDGDGSTWINGHDICVGRYGSGTLNINNGGAVSNSYGYIGHEADSTGEVTVDGTGSTWTNSLYLYVGYYGDGTLNITNGGAVSNGITGYIGFLSGSTSEVTVDGSGSTWTNNSGLTVGYEGNGTLNITNGAAVTVAGTTHVAYNAGSTGTIDFGGGGTLTTQSLWAVATHLTGTGTISTRGLVGFDVDLVFDSTHGSSHTFMLDSQPGQNITVNLDLSDPDNVGELGIGYQGNGSLSIRDGVKVNSLGGFIGYNTGSTGVATITGAGSTWNNRHYNLYVGREGDGTLNITNGGTVGNGHGYIGYEAGSTGKVTVGGTDSTWNNSYSSLYVGHYGDGTLNITNGGTVSNSDGYIGRYLGSTGEVTVDGGGSTWTNSQDLYVGRDGSGTLNINNGGAVSNNRYGYIGYKSGTTGEVTVDGTGSTWTNGSDDLYVGYYGDGALNITNGGAVINNSYNHIICIGYYSSSTGEATVDGSGSTWRINYDSDLSVGCGGDGTLNITNGGDVSNSDGYIGHYSGSTGEVTVDGSGSTWTNNSALTVGYEGSGTLNITNGGAVTVDGPTRVAFYTDSTGTIDFGAGGGTLTTRSLQAAATDLTGTGTINTRGLVGDFDLVFDSTHGLSQTLTFNSQPGQNITVNLDMNDPDNVGVLGMGYRGNGSLSIRDGVKVNSRVGYIGYNTGSTGVATITGAGSTWTSNHANLYVGHWGDGTLNITDGGAVGDSSGYIGYNTGSTGVVTVDGSDSTWNNGSRLRVGNSGIGTLNIANGGAVGNRTGHIGFDSGSTGVVTVDGTGSTWTNSTVLGVGVYGDGTLNITGGGAVSCGHDYGYGYIGTYSNSTGVVTVDGTGSTWNNGSYLYVGSSGDGTLNITGGGSVTATKVSINSQSLLAIDVGNGSALIVGGGRTIDNDGVVRVMAGAGPTAGATYAPISACTWSGSGTCQALGGTWGGGGHVFTVSEVEPGASGTPVAINLATKQRVLIGDGIIGWSLGLSFAAKESSTPLTLTATAISGKTLTDLEAMLDPSQAVLGGWELEVTGGYTTGDPAYLSFDVGEGFSRSDLNLWHYDGIEWSEFDAMDLTYDGTYASFTVTGFSGYAVTAVPEPGTLVSLLVGAATLALFARRRSRCPRT